MIFDALSEYSNTRRLKRQMACVSSRRALPVIVYQMGKVASSTIEATLRELPGVEVFRAHRLNRFNEQRPARAPRRLFESWFIFENLIRPRVPAKIITAVREPIGRNISGYFQNLDVLWGKRNVHLNLSMDELIRGFFEKFNHQRVLEWFDEQFNPVLGVNVYEHPFDHTAGFQRISQLPYDILTLRVETSDEIKAREIARLIGLPSLSLVQKNVGENKRYATVYQEFRRALRLPASYVDEMLSHHYTRHYFSAQEIEQLRKKWLRPAD